MSDSALAAGVLALMKPVKMTTGLAVFDTRADSTASGAWFVAIQNLPRVSERGEAGPIHAYRCTLRLLMVNQTANGVRILADHARGALEGVRPVAAGWQTSALHQFNEVAPYDDTDYTNPSTNTRFMVGVLEYEFTATHLP